MELKNEKNSKSHFYNIFYYIFFRKKLDRIHTACYNKLLSEQTRRTQGAMPRFVCTLGPVIAGSLSPKGGATKMAKYETMLITSAALDEEATAALVGKFKSLIEANGTIDSIDEWGKRRLAYPINDEEEGVYTVIDFTSEPSFPAELDRVYKITEGVMRSLIIAHEE